MFKRRSHRVLFFTLAAAILAFIAAGVAIVMDGLRDEAGQADVAVVLGSKVGKDGRLSPRLQARLDKAVALYEAGAAPEIIVSGATGEEGYSEPEAMRAYLVEQGVPEDHVHMDPQGFNTYETARNTARWMKMHGKKSVLAVTQHFHIPRTRLALRRFGIENVYTAHADFYEARDLYSTAREVAAWGAYLLKEYPHAGE